jgi:hypothetical protein
MNKIIATGIFVSLVVSILVPGKVNASLPEGNVPHAGISTEDSSRRVNCNDIVFNLPPDARQEIFSKITISECANEAELLQKTPDGKIESGTWTPDGLKASKPFLSNNNEGRIR